MDGSLVIRLREDNHKLLAAVPGNQISRPREHILQCFGNHPETGVTFGMTELIVELLKMIHIDHDQRQGEFVAHGALGFQLQHLVEFAAIADVRQTVEKGHFFQHICFQLELQMGFHARLDDGRVKRLPDVIDGSNFQAFLLGFILIFRRNKYNRNIFCRLVVLQSPAYLVSVHLRHHNIQQNQIRLAPSRLDQPLFSGDAGNDRLVHTGKYFFQ